MCRTYTAECNGYIVTVWMLGVELWAYRVSRGATLYPVGYVNATNRIDAAAAALAEVLAEKDAS